MTNKSFVSTNLNMGRRCGYQTENPHHLLLGFPLFSRVLLDLGLGLGLGSGLGLGLGSGLGLGLGSG